MGVEARASNCLCGFEMRCSGGIGPGRERGAGRDEPYPIGYGPLSDRIALAAGL